MTGFKFLGFIYINNKRYFDLHEETEMLKRAYPMFYYEQIGNFAQTFKRAMLSNRPAVGPSSESVLVLQF